MFSFLRSSPLVKNNLLILFTSHFVLDFFTGIWPIYKTIAGIDMAKAGLIAGISGFIGESLQLVFGYFSDKGFRKHILLFGLLAGSSILWVTFSESLTSYFCILLLLNIGSGSFHPAGAGYAGTLSEEHKAKTILIFVSGGLLGLACSQMIFTKILTLSNGHALFLLAPLSLLFLWLFIHQFPSSAKQGLLSKKGILEEFLKKKKLLSLLYLTQLCNYALVLSLVFLLPDILAAKTTASWLKFGGGHFCYILGSALTLPFMGHLCDKYGQKKVILTAISCGIILFYTLANSYLLGLLDGAILLFFLGACLNSVSPMIISWGHKIVPSSPSTVSALLMGLAWCFSYLGPIVASILYKHFEKEPEVQTLYYMGILLFLSLAFAAMTPTEEKELAPS